MVPPRSFESGMTLAPSLGKKGTIDVSTIEKIDILVWSHNAVNEYYEQGWAKVAKRFSGQ